MILLASEVAMVLKLEPREEKKLPRVSIWSGVKPWERKMAKMLAKVINSQPDKLSKENIKITYFIIWVIFYFAINLLLKTMCDKANDTKNKK